MKNQQISDIQYNFNYKNMTSSLLIKKSLIPASVGSHDERDFPKSLTFSLLRN